MKLINLKSKKGIVNLFADFILNKFDRFKNTVIEVSDFNHFFIINGRTDSKEVLDLSKVRDEFISEYQDLLKIVGYEESINIMDLIKYEDKSIKKCNSICFDYFDSERPIYHHKIIDYKFNSEKIYSIDNNLENTFEVSFGFESDNLKFLIPSNQVTSQFPYGYSLSMGRKLMYYGEYIVFNIKDSFLSNIITLKITENKNKEGEQEINLLIDSIHDKNVKSMILDNFDFNFDYFENKFKDYNFCNDITNQTNKKLWLIKDINTKDLVII
jgi:hypothetical protein